MKHLVVGTAGHVDHGKTLLVKALTGVDTDRLPEEKRRGLTIEPGFAFLSLVDGTVLSLVDVPGHDRFIKNMLAGACAIDCALLAVAADEGVMPQTREHFQILQLLGLRVGVIALTKTDLADDVRQQEVRAQLAALTHGSFLQDAPVVPVCARTGEGIAALKQTLGQLAAQIPSKPFDRAWRLPVDRVFSLDGFGTIATGTLTDGTLSAGDAMLYPAGTAVRIRGLQSHGATVAAACAGQRVAVNLAGVKPSALHRGDLLAAPGSLTPAQMLDVRLSLLPDAARGVSNGARLHFYTGAKAALCKVILLGQDALAPGGSGFAQLRFAEPLAVRERDRFIVRFYSPLETIGGGIVLDPNPVCHKQRNPEICAQLAALELGTSDTLACHTLTQTFTQQLREFHARFPMQSGMPIEQARLLLLPGAGADMLARLEMAGVLRQSGRVVSLPDFAPQYSPRCARILAQLEKQFAAAPLSPPTLSTLCEQYSFEKSDLRRVVAAMRADGRLVALSADILFSRASYAQAVGVLRRQFAQSPSITVAKMRDLLHTSRKYARALLEHWDAIGVTRREGDVHLPLHLDRV